MSDVRFVPLFLVQNGKICICLFQCWANDNIEQIERTIASFVMLDALNIIWDWVYPVVWNVDLCVCGTHSIATLPATTKHDVAQLFWESQRVSYGVHTPHEHIDRSLWNYMQLKGQRQRTTFYMDSWLQIIVYVCVEDDLEQRRLFILLSCHPVRFILFCESALWSFAAISLPHHSSPVFFTRSFHLYNYRPYSLCSCIFTFIIFFMVLSHVLFFFVFIVLYFLLFSSNIFALW